MAEQLIAIFCDIDDFCKEYKSYCTTHLLMDKEHIVPRTSMSLSEIMTIVVCFHRSQYRTFKWYCKNHVCDHMREYFPHLVSYNRFVEIMQSSIVLLTLYLMSKRFGKCSGISFVDSHRIYSNRVFADRGYLSAKLFEKLWERKIQLITKLKKNMKNKLMDYTEKLLLRKRAVIESVYDFLKNVCQIEHSRHRSVTGFLVNVVSALAAYSFLPSKPSLDIFPLEHEFLPF